MRIWPFGKKKVKESPDTPRVVSYNKFVTPVGSSSSRMTQTTNYSPSRRTSYDDDDADDAYTDVLRGAMLGAALTSGDAHVSAIAEPERRFDTQSLYRDENIYRHETPSHSSHSHHAAQAHGSDAIGGSAPSSYDSGSGSDSGSSPSYSE